MWIYRDLPSRRWQEDLIEAMEDLQPGGEVHVVAADPDYVNEHDDNDKNGMVWTFTRKAGDAAYTCSEHPPSFVNPPPSLCDDYVSLVCVWLHENPAYRVWHILTECM